MAGISSKALNGVPKNNEKTFQDQRFDDEFGLDWVQFKWRNHDPQIGRFIEIDPLAEKYVYNSTYAFSENKVTNHIELEGLEATAPAYLQKGLEDIGTGVANFFDNIFSFFTTSSVSTSVKSQKTRAETVVTATTQTEYGTNLLGWVLQSKVPEEKRSSDYSFFKTKTTSEVKVELQQEIKTNQGSSTSKTAVDGSSVEVEVSSKKTIRGIPFLGTLSNANNFKTGEKKTSVQIGIGVEASNVFGKVEQTKKDGNTSTSISIGIEQKTKTGKKSVSIGKSFF